MGDLLFYEIFVLGFWYYKKQSFWECYFTKKNIFLNFSTSEKIGFWLFSTKTSLLNCCSFEIIAFDCFLQIKPFWDWWCSKNDSFEIAVLQKWSFCDCDTRETIVLGLLSYKMMGSYDDGLFSSDCPSGGSDRRLS